MPQSGLTLMHLTTVPQTLGFLQGQVAYMKTQGLQVVCVSSPGPRLDDFGAREHVPVHGVIMSRRISPLADLRSLAQLGRLMRQERPAIVHAHTPKAGLLGMLAARMARVPVRIYHIHGLPYMTARGWKRRLLQTTERIACRLAHQVLCVSHSVREVAVADGICPEGKVKVLVNGSINGVDSKLHFNPERFLPEDRRQMRREWGVPEDATVLLFVGRLVRDKGVGELAAAWRQLRDRNPGMYLVVAGEFEPQDPVPADAVDTLHRDERIVLLGNVPHDSMPETYFACDALVLPTYREGLPYVPLEAAAMNLPVLATDIPGCVESVLNGVTGTLVTPGDAWLLAEAMQRYVDYPLLRLQHGLAGRDRVVERMAQQPIWEATWSEYQRQLLRWGVLVKLDLAEAGERPLWRRAS